MYRTPAVISSIDLSSLLLNPLNFILHKFFLPYVINVLIGNYDLALNNVCTIKRLSNYSEMH